MGAAVRKLHAIEWVLGAVVTTVAVLVWAGSRQVGAQQLSIYDIFPVFGLVAFGLMWTHYVSGAIRRLMNIERPRKSMYWSISSGLVLAAIILHPLLFNFGLVQDGIGLPPKSYFEVYPVLGWYVILGTAALLIFLSFELKRWWGKKSWWKWVERAQILAMTAIFIHSLVLGRELASGWFMILWWLYGVTLVAAWVYNYYYDKKMKEGEA